MLSAYYGHADLVKFLIQNGADPNRLNDKRQSPLAGAVFKRLDDVVEVSHCHCYSVISFFLSFFLIVFFTDISRTGSRGGRRGPRLRHTFSPAVHRHVQAGGQVEGKVRVCSRPRQGQGARGGGAGGESPRADEVDDVVDTARPIECVFLAWH